MRRTTRIAARSRSLLGLLPCLLLLPALVASLDPGPPPIAARPAGASGINPPTSPQREPHPQQEPIIDPLPPLRPAFLPLAMRAYDPRLPEPLSSTLRGYLHALRPLGRERCAPATHVLLDKPEGTLGAAALAVLHAPRSGPNLDFYAGAFVELRGLQSFAPADCRILTEWLIQVTAVKVIELPPGAGIEAR